MNNTQKASRIVKLQNMIKMYNAELKSLQTSLITSCKEGQEHKYGPFRVKKTKYTSITLDAKDIKMNLPEIYEHFSKSIDKVKLIVKAV